MKILLAGGGGFIGSQVANILVAEKVETVILDNFSSDFKQSNIDGAEVINGSICDEKTLKSAMKNVTHVWHGAYPHNIHSRVDDVVTIWQNIRSTIQFAEFARRRHVKKFVYVSSRSVYGRPQYNPMDEKHPIEPVTEYGLCKAICEDYLNNIFEKSRTNLCILRGFLVYGPGDRQSVVAKFAQKIHDGKSLKVYGNGSATRDFIHVKDMAAASILAIKKANAKGTFNIGSGKETSLLELISLLTDITDRKVPVHFVKEDAWNVNDRCFADINLASEVLGFNPSVTLKDGLRQVVETTD